ncbi:MAG: tetratricopeptide repeat protein [Armatimonadota bacterium]
MAARGRSLFSPARPPLPPAERERRIQEINRLVGYAHQAYRRGQLRDARRYCDQALALGRSGAAYELLGDIALRQDRAADAVRHYTIAAQLMPSPGLVMSKLNRAAARAAQIGGRDYDLSQLGVRRAPQQANRRFYQLSLSCFGVAVVLLLAFLAAAFQGEPLGWPILGTWSLYQLVFMSLAGVVSGALLAAVAWIRPIDQELLFPAAGSSRRGISLGLLTIPLAFLFFPAAVIIYVVAGSIRGTISNSVLVVFAVATAVAFAFMLVVPDVAKTETLMFGGNIVFLTMLFGWLIGDLFRPDWVP